MNIIDLILEELFVIPIWLGVWFVVKKYQKFTKRNHRKPRGFYGGEGHISSFPDESAERVRQKIQDNNS